MSISCAVLMCHAPIVIPAIAGREAAHCSATTEAMRQTARALLAHEPSLIVLISPHAPRRPKSLGLTFDEELRGDFARFGYAQLALRVRGAPEAAEQIMHHAHIQHVATHALSGRALDHGSMVPLFFVHEAGYRGRVVVASLPYPGSELEPAFGHALREAARMSQQRWAVLASGDMSHRLSHDAPAGFDPRAHEFDKAFARALRQGDLRSAVSADPELLELAAEDVVQSTAVAAAAVRYQAQGTRVFAYEAPFGVGYLEALLFSHDQLAPSAEARRSRAQPRASTQPRAPDDSPPYVLIEIALAAIQHALRGTVYVPPELAPPWDTARAVFVTLRAPDGELRGCIGRTQPVLTSLAEEVADCAVGAALRDLRMESVRLEELGQLQVEVSVLHPQGPVHDLSQLDPGRYGLIAELGKRRGVLLPDVEGVSSVAQQVQITLQKGGISEHAPYTLSRFTVDKVRRDGSVARRAPAS